MPDPSETVTVFGTRRQPFRSSILERVSNAVTQKALDTVQAKIPRSARKHLPLARKLLTGGVDALINAGLDELFERFGISGTLLPSPALVLPSALLGGITLADARRMMENHSSIDFAKKNLWCIRVRNIQGGEPMDINLFAQDVSYPMFSAQGDPVHIGSGSFDNVTGSERREIRVTTLDDSQGSVKRWFADRYHRMCRLDGTFGLPIEYVFKVDVLHAYINEQIEGAVDGWIDSFVMRPGTMDTDLSRRENGLQELQLTFVQWDTFANLT